MENTIDHIDELIGKYLAEEASAKERDEVELWVQAREENRTYFNQLKAIFEEAAKIKEWQQFDTDAAWNKVKGRIHPSGARTISMRPRDLSLYWRIAASFLLILSLSYFAYLLLNPRVETFAIQSETTTLQDTLPDGSRAFLNKGSSITFAYNPREKVRRVKLAGEAHFDVVHQEEKPFIIEAEEVIIEDIGTAFNVKAHPQDPLVEVFVESGEVAFYTKQNPGLRLIAGQTGIYDRTTKVFTLVSQPDLNVLAYKTRVFDFQNTDLGTIVRQLNDVYEKEILLEDESLKSCRIYVAFQGESIDTIADIIAETLGLKMTVTDNAILLDGEGCGQQ